MLKRIKMRLDAVYAKGKDGEFHLAAYAEPGPEPETKRVDSLAITAAVFKGEKSYQSRVKLHPVKHDYGDGYFKYSCPICESLGLHHSLSLREDTCFCCGVNLDWDEI